MSNFIEMVFAHSYTCEETELCLPYDIRRFPSDKSAGNNGLLLRIAPVGSTSWTGLFAAGKEHGINKVLSLPDPTMLCVVARGHGYIVNTEVPERWASVEIDPIKHALSVKTHGLVVLADDRSLIAVGETGVAWRTGPIAIDGMTVVGPIDDDLVITYDDGEMSQTVRIDLTSGLVNVRALDSR